MRYAVFLACLVACARPLPAAPPVHLTSVPPPAAVASSKTAILSGRVVDSKTRAGIAGAEVIAFPPSPVGQTITLHDSATVTDEHGAYRIALAPTTYDLVASVDAARDVHDQVVLASGTTAEDFVLDHDAVISARNTRPPLACPGSPPATVVRGHSASQDQIDEVARAVLGRAGTIPATIPDARSIAEVQAEIESPAERRLTSRAAPVGSALRTHEELQAEADRTGHDVWYVSFSQLDTDGSCAVVEVGGCDVSPSHTRRGSPSCGCEALDLYEKHAGRWVFVRRVYQACE